MKKLLVNISRGFLVMLSWLPLKFHYFMGRILAWMMRKIFRYRYSVVLTNVARSFPEKSYKQVARIADGFYVHLGEIIAETIWFSGSKPERLCNFTNPELLAEYFEKSPSMTVLSTHCGNWELLGGIFAYLKKSGCTYPFTPEHMRVVYKKLSSDVADEVFKRNRIAPLEKVGTECEVESNNILRHTLKQKNMRKRLQR